MSEPKYDLEVDLTVRGNHTIMVEMIGFNKRVLEVGCATGYMSRVLTERGCRVVGIEIDPLAAEKARPHCEQVLTGDVEGIDLVTAFGSQSFDVLVFGDVLEHLKDPLGALRRARPLLVPGGYVVASIPNVAHGAVRLSLMKGRFDYRPLGLLDETHLRFFTRDTVGRLFHEGGFVLAEVERVHLGFFDTEIPLEAGEFPPEVIREVEADPEASTYQFVAKALLDDGLQAVKELQEREEKQRLELLTLKGRIETLAREGQTRETRIAALEAEREALVRERDALRAHADNLQRQMERLTEHARASEARPDPLDRTEGDRESWRSRALDAERRDRERESALRLLRAEVDGLRAELDTWRRRGQDALKSPPHRARSVPDRRWAAQVARRVWSRVPESGKRAARPLVRRLVGDREEHPDSRAALRAAAEQPSGGNAGTSPGPTIAAPRRVTETVSVLIPTLNGGPDFARTLSAILAQEDVADLELIVADSGSTDDTVEIARARGARVIEVPKGEFSHGGTRNRLAETATGSVLLLTVQDAVLLGRHALRDLVLSLRSDPTLAAVSATQVPRSDSDAFGAFLTVAHNRAMIANRPEPGSLRIPFHALTLAERRSLCSIDNVCAVIDRAAWESLRFRDISFGEDLDFGLRAVEQGWRTSVQDGVAVAHSHRRDAAYHLRRFVIDRICLATILGDPDIDPVAREGTEAVAGGARLLLTEIQAAADAAAGDVPQVELHAYLESVVQTLRTSTPGRPPRDELALLDSLLDGEDTPPPGGAVVRRLREGLFTLLEWRILRDFAHSHPAIAAAEAAEFLSRTAAVAIGSVLGDAIRLGSDSSPLAARLQSEV